MSVRPISFAAGQSSSVEELAGGMPPQVNAFVDAAGAVTMRPAITVLEPFTDVEPLEGAPTPVVGLAMFNGTLVFMTQVLSSGFYQLVTTAIEQKARFNFSIGGSFPGINRPVLTPSREALWISNGGELYAYPGPGNSFSGPANAGTLFNLGSLGSAILPIKTTHPCLISQRIVVAQTGPSGNLYWSEPGDAPYSTTRAGHLIWNYASERREAEDNPDGLVACRVSAGELVAIGTRSIQMLSPDPSITFTPSRTIPFGSRAGHSYVGMDEQFLLVDTRSRIMQSNGRSYSSVSTPAIGRELSRMSADDVALCWGFRCNIDDHDFAVFNFPGRTFAYDVPSKQWSEWRSWKNGAWAPLQITAHFYEEETKTHMVGLDNGSIAQLSMTATTDLGAPIVAELTSTFVDHGTMAWKLSEVVRFRFRRGQAASSTTEALVSYRDAPGPFGEPFRIPLGDSSDVNPVVELRSMGTFQQRQWKIIVDSSQFTFAGAEEQFSVLTT